MEFAPKIQKLLKNPCHKERVIKLLKRYIYRSWIGSKVTEAGWHVKEGTVVINTDEHGICISECHGVMRFILFNHRTCDVSITDISAIKKNGVKLINTVDPQNITILWEKIMKIGSGFEDIIIQFGPAPSQP